MTNIKRGMCLLLSTILLLGMLVSCGPQQSPSATPDATPTPTVTATPSPTPEAGLKEDLVLSDFYIIYPTKKLTDSAQVQNAATSLCTSILSETSVICYALDDSMDESQGYYGEYEILIGKTNRAESQQVLAMGLSHFNYVIKFIGKKIVILGGSDEATVEAVTYFAENMLTAELNTVEGMKTMMTTDYTYTSPWTKGVKAWLTNGFDKISADTKCKSDEFTHYDVYTAKNESEAVQIFLESVEDYEGLDLEVVGDYDGIRVETFYEHSNTAKNGERLYDALVPLSAKKLDIKKGIAQAMLVRFVTDKTVAGGDYEYVLRLVDQSGDIYTELTVTVHVWGFALPDTPTTKTECGILTGYIEKMHGNKNTEELYIKYYEMLLDHKMSPYDLPYDVLDDRADKYMSDPRVTSFRLPYSYDDARMVAMYEKLKTNEEWFKKAYFYPIDEPGTVEAVDTAVAMCERINTLCPGIKTCVPMHRMVEYDAERDTIDVMSDAFTLWVPKMFLMDSEDVLERMNEYMANGEEVWWYVCWEPANPYCNVLMDQLGVQHRMLFWQQVQHNVTGFLYWCTNYWEYVDPWEDPATVKNLSDTVYGDGMLLYNGNKVGIDGPCSSLRLVTICDGLEDADMLNIAKELFGEEWVNEKIATLSTSLTKYSRSSAALEQMRLEIGNAINNELNK